MGNNGSNAPTAENNREEQSRESVSPPGTKRYPLRPQSLIGVDCESYAGNGKHLGCGQVERATQHMIGREQGRMPADHSASPNFPLETKRAGVTTKRPLGDVSGVTTRNHSTGDVVDSDTDHTCHSMADPRTAQCATATDATVGNCRGQYANSTPHHDARSKFDERNDACEATVSYQPVISCTDIKLVDNKVQLPRARRFDERDANNEVMDHKVCTVRQPETRTRQSPDGESMNLDLNPNEENAMFVHKESSDHLDSDGQKDDHDGSGMEIDQPVDVAGSPVQYEDCVEYIESGHTDRLPALIDLAVDRPETEGREVLLGGSIEKEGDNPMDEMESARSNDKTSPVSINEPIFNSKLKFRRYPAIHTHYS